MLSIAVRWLVSVVLLWAARAPMLDLLRRLGSGLDEGLGAAARACGAAGLDGAVLDEAPRQGDRAPCRARP